MRNTIFGRRGLSLAMAAVLVVSLPATRPAWAVAMSSTRELLASELPPGVTLQRATTAQTADAVHAAVKARPDLATDIVRVALMAKMARHREYKDGKDGVRDPEMCDTVRQITRAAISAAPDRANDITQMALSMDPGCADALNAVNGTGADQYDPSLTQGFNSPEDIYGGFGVGFGPGFPGSPGFTGSPPSGAIALPTATPAPVTAAVNG